VNEHNQVAFADRLPPPRKGDQPTYVGVEVCTKCHDDARAFWDKTKHSHAYKTLSDQSKEFNLDCVSCHVTGYEQPGGSSVTHVDKLESVQCEVCHGPGSKHSAAPKKVAQPVKKPKSDLCVSCHHPPHVEAFDAKAAMDEIIGPGHGL
jgi:RecJ-like exonuclease